MHARVVRVEASLTVMLMVMWEVDPRHGVVDVCGSRCLEILRGWVGWGWLAFVIGEFGDGITRAGCALLRPRCCLDCLDCMNVMCTVLRTDRAKPRGTRPVVRRVAWSGGCVWYSDWSDERGQHRIASFRCRHSHSSVSMQVSQQAGRRHSHSYPNSSITQIYSETANFASSRPKTKITSHGTSSP
ncbi:hypothetical protein BDW22DRAFT_141835 [Trametopsis cervina]|nr:hypothetical protein BDW22DRAFT_141835 [Trametopsis cervina]